MGSFSIAYEVTFTATHAKHLASKVSADLKRMQRFYNHPSDSWISEHEAELIELLKNGYLDTMTHGFQRDGKWIEPTLRYEARDLGGMQSADDNPGKIRPGANISGSIFNSYATYTAKWNALSSTERDSFKKNQPFYRGGAAEPSVSGYLESDRTYASGGKALNRSTVRSY